MAELTYHQQRRHCATGKLRGRASSHEPTAEITGARLKILREAERVGVVAPIKQRQRTVERMARDGLLIKAGRGRDYQLTDKGRGTLAALK